MVHQDCPQKGEASLSIPFFHPTAQFTTLLPRSTRARWIASASRPSICGHIVRSPEWASSPLLRHLHKRLPVLESKALLIFEVKGPTLPLSSPSPPSLLLVLTAVVVCLARGVAVGGRAGTWEGPILHPSRLLWRRHHALTRCGGGTHDPRQI